MNNEEIIEKIKKIKRELEKTGNHAFVPVENEREHFEEIQNYYSKTKLDLTDKGIKQALIANSLTFDWN